MHLLLFFLLFFVVISVQGIDENGYVVYCPCMGRFGNQVEHFIGSLSFAHNINRTLILPPWIEYEGGKLNATMMDFDTYFRIEPLEKYHRVITMRYFMKNIAVEIWPISTRNVLCWAPRSNFYGELSIKGCHAKEGNPFGPFWDYSGINFVGDIYFGDINNAYDLDHPDTLNEWRRRFPPKKYPVLAFSGAPARFPVQEKDKKLQTYLEWTLEIDEKADEFIRQNLAPRPFLGIHLRNDVDWDNVCNLIDEHFGMDEDLFASSQCSQHLKAGKLTRNVCSPPTRVIVKELDYYAKLLNAKSLFVSSDRNHLIDQLSMSLKSLQMKVHRRIPDDPQISLAILIKSDHFIGNCVSTFSAFVKRRRDLARNSTSSFFGTEKRPFVRENVEL